MARRRKRKYDKRAKKEEEGEYQPLVGDETKKSIAIIIILAAAFLTILALFDLAGSFGHFISSSLGSALGWGLYFFPVILLLLGYLMLRPEKYQVRPSNYLGIFLLFLSVAGLLQFFNDFNQPTAYASGAGGGFLGYSIFMPLQKIMGSMASFIILLALFFISS